MSHYAENQLRQLVGLPLKEEPSRKVAKIRREEWNQKNKTEPKLTSVEVEPEPEVPEVIAVPAPVPGRLVTLPPRPSSLAPGKEWERHRADRRASIIKAQESRERAVFGDRFLPKPPGPGVKKSAIGDFDLSDETDSETPPEEPANVML